MVDFVPLHPLGNLASLVAAHRFTGPGDAPVRIGIRGKTSCAQLFAGKGGTAKLAAKLKIASEPGRATKTRNYTALPLSPGQWLVSSNSGDDGLAANLMKSVGGLGHVSDQSDARICIRVSGAMARQLMARGCRLDLDGAHSGPGFCAQTVMAQVGVIIHQLAKDEGYEVYVYSGFARSFFDWLTHTAAQFGYEVSVIK